MYSMTLEGLMNLGNSDYTREYSKYLVIEIQVGNNATEIIINPKEHFPAKLSYYREAYNEDLTLKADPDIKIVNYEFVPSISDYFQDSDLYE